MSLVATVTDKIDTVIGSDKHLGNVQQNVGIICDEAEEDCCCESPQIREYEFLKNLAPQGGDFGAVYLYRNTRTRATVKVKEVSYNKDDDDTLNKVMLQIEYFKHIKHANIAAYHDCFIVGPQREMYIAQEHAKRGSLRLMLIDRIVKWELFTQTEAVELIREIICGIRFLNSIELVMWGISPEHIMVGDDGYLKICDYGPDRKWKINWDTPAGVRAYSYLSPESLNAMRSDEKSLVWSIGIIFYELCTLQHPYEPITAIEEMLPKFREGEINKFNCHYDYDIKEFLEWMLQKDRCMRRTLKDLLQHRLMKIRSPVYLFVE